MNASKKRHVRPKRRTKVDFPDGNPVAFKTTNTDRTKLTTGVKRKNYNSECPPAKKPHFDVKIETPNQSKRYSANERLARYRECLANRKNEIVKVHEVFTSPVKNEDFITSTPIKGNTNNEINVPVTRHPTKSNSVTEDKFNPLDVKSPSKTWGVSNNKTPIKGTHNKSVQNRLINTWIDTSKETKNTNEHKSPLHNNSPNVSPHKSPKHNHALNAKHKKNVSQDYKDKYKELCNIDRSESLKWSPKKNNLKSVNNPKVTTPNDVQNRLLNIKKSGPSLNESTHELRDSIPSAYNFKCDLSQSITTPLITSIMNTSKDNSNTSMICNVGSFSNVDEDLDCEMDWSPINENEVISDIQRLRESITEKEIYFKHISDGVTTNDSNISEDSNVYIVVDTNIFISQLSLIKNIMKFETYGRVPVVYIPWMVLQELDYFKDRRSGSKAIQNTARQAIRFINASLSLKTSHMKGQSVQDALKQELTSSNADDGILFCCMQLVQNNKTTILLSSDLNLRNKALINGILSYGPNDIFEKIKALKSSESKQASKSDQIVTIFTDLCSNIVEKEMVKAYGSTTYKIITKPPWSLKSCLMYLKRFWSPVFSLIITQKQCLKIIDDLLNCITTHEDLSGDHIEEFTKLCLSLCVYFKNCLKDYAEDIKVCISKIQEIVN